MFQKLKKLLKLDYLDRPGTFNLFQFKSYDKLTNDYFVVRNRKERTSFLRTMFGASSLLFWGLASLLISLLYLIFLLLSAIVNIKNLSYYKAVTEDKVLSKYLKFYNHKPALCFFKILEGKLFADVKIKSPSLEIGIENGLVSKLHFEGTKIDVGTEFVPDTIIDAKNSGDFNKLVSMDLRKICFERNSFNLVLLVHILDHFPEIDEALDNVRHVLRPGGEVAFSTFSSNLFDSDIFYKLFKKINFKLARSYCSKLAKRREAYNLFSSSNWAKKIEDSGFTITKFANFLGGPKKYIWSFSFFYFETLGGTEISKILKKMGLMPKILDKFFNLCFSLIYGPALSSVETKDGVNIFVIARPNKNDPTTGSPDKLICPVCKLEVSQESLKCKKCLYQYKTIDDIPILIPNNFSSNH